MKKRIWYGKVLHYLNSSLIIALLLIPSEFATESLLYRSFPLIACGLVYVWFLIWKKRAAETAAFRNRLTRACKTFIPLALAALFAFWPLTLRSSAEEILRWYDARPLKYSGISWPSREKNNYDNLCLDAAKANVIDPIRMVTSEFKLSVPKGSASGRYYGYVDITSSYPNDWVLFRVFPRLSSQETVKLHQVGDTYEHWKVESVRPGEHITFVSCWQNIRSSIPRIKCKNAISVQFRESDRQ